MKQVSHLFFSLLFAICFSSCSKASNPPSETILKENSAITVGTVEEIEQAIERAQPGSQIIVKSGEYNFKDRLFLDDSGTPANLILLKGESTTNRPIFNFGSMPVGSSNQGIVLKADYWLIKNIEITKTGDNGMRIQGHHNKIENCSFSNCSDTGLQLDGGASENLILNCDSYFNADPKEENADGFAAKMDVGSKNKFVGCRAWNNSDDGWDGYLRANDQIISTSYENCWAIHNGYRSDNSRSEGDGNGFKTGGSDSKQAKHNASYDGCIAIENFADGFDHNSNRGTVQITNSLSVNNGRNFAFSEKNALSSLTITNSVSIGTLGKFNADQIQLNGNSWQSNPKQPQHLDEEIIQQFIAPRKSDGSLPDVDLLGQFGQSNDEVTTIYLIGDSTMADYSGDYDPGKDYMKTRYPMTGWGQVFQEFFVDDSLAQLDGLIHTKKVVVDDRARGGRSTRTFFQEGRWRAVFEQLQPGDIVIMQFGHNDAAENKPERYVNIEGYKEFLRLYVSQSREKGAIPIILTPVARNYPWKNGILEDVHGAYDQAPKDIASEMQVELIDLNKQSRELFTKKGKEYTTNHYFMNLPANTYEAYPDGDKDDTHFQPEGAKAVAGIVFQGLTSIAKKNNQ